MDENLIGLALSLGFAAVLGLEIEFLPGGMLWVFPTMGLVGFVLIKWAEKNGELARAREREEAAEAKRQARLQRRRERRRELAETRRSSKDVEQEPEDSMTELSRKVVETLSRATGKPVNTQGPGGAEIWVSSVPKKKVKDDRNGRPQSE